MNRQPVANEDAAEAFYYRCLAADICFALALKLASGEPGTFDVREIGRLMKKAFKLDKGGTIV